MDHNKEVRASYCMNSEEKDTSLDPGNQERRLRVD